MRTKAITVSSRARIALWLLLSGACALGACRDDDALATNALAFEAMPESPTALASAVARLAVEVETRSPGTEIGLAVYDAQTREYAGVGDDVTHVSASAAKAIWVAAALANVGIEAVRPYAGPVFVDSSNDAAAAVIDLAGPNAINDFYGGAGMTKSAYTQWQGAHVATNSPRLMGANNYVTARDGVAFLSAFLHGAILDADASATLRAWMTWSPRRGFGGWLGSRLPEAAAATMLHKAGWLPPPYTERCVNELGIVEAGQDHRYAIAILARYGRSYEAEKAFVEHASCEVYKAVSNDEELTCD